MPLVLVLFFASLLGYFGIHQAQRDTMLVQRASEDSAAINVIAYLNALKDYRATHAVVSGSITDAQITMPTGMLRDTNWQNTVSDGRLWVYQQTPANVRGLLSDLTPRQAPNGIFVGTRAGAALTTVSGYPTGIAFPASVPVGAIVLVTR